MRRLFLLATSLLLSGCAGSGFYSYLDDTTRLPFHDNPNEAPGYGENYAKVVTRHAVSAEPPPILFEAGDVWPAPPTPPPTLRDLQKQQANATRNGGFAPLQPLPNLPGFEVPKQQPSPYIPGAGLPSTSVPHGVGKNFGTGGGENLNTKSDGTIIVPNGNGTSTVISPNGAVTTVPTPGK